MSIQYLILSAGVVSVVAAAMAMCLVAGFDWNRWLSLGFAATSAALYQAFCPKLPTICLLVIAAVFSVIALAGNGRPWCGWAVAAALWLGTILVTVFIGLPAAWYATPVAAYGLLAFVTAGIVARRGRKSRPGWVVVGLAVCVAVTIMANNAAASRPSYTLGDSSGYVFSDSAIEAAVQAQLNQ